MSFYDFSASSIHGRENYLSEFKGKITLVVNIASKYGYEPQCSKLWSYARTCRQLGQLQEVHEEFSDRGFSVLAFPCNQFGSMDPGTNEEIADFIKQNPMGWSYTNWIKSSKTSKNFDSFKVYIIECSKYSDCRNLSNLTRNKKSNDFAFG